jgi:succinylarginine dihydrolase
MTLVAPTECRDTPSVARWIERHLASNGAIRRVDFVDVRQSMANGGGPACLRLRVACDPATVDARFLVDEARLDRLAAAIAAHWPEQIAVGELTDPTLVTQIVAARAALLEALDLG